MFQYNPAPQFSSMESFSTLNGTDKGLVIMMRRAVCSTLLAPTLLTSMTCVPHNHTSAKHN